MYKTLLKPVKFVKSESCFRILFLLYLSVLLLVFQIVGSYLCGNDVGIVVEVNFLFIEMSEEKSFFKSSDLSKHFSSK